MVEWMAYLTMQQDKTAFQTPEDIDAQIRSVLGGKRKSR